MTIEEINKIIEKASDVKNKARSLLYNLYF